MRRSHKQIQRSARLAAVIANPTRVAILMLLHERKRAYVGEIVAALDLTQSAVSHQLALLVEQGVVVFTKEGRDVLYRLSKKDNSRRLLKALRNL